MSSTLITESGPFFNACPDGKAVQFSVNTTPTSTTQFVRVVANLGMEGGEAIRLVFDVMRGRITTLDMRGWRSVSFEIPRSENASSKLELNVIWRDVTLETSGLVLYQRFDDADGNGNTEGDFVPMGATRFQANIDTDVFWQSPEGSRTQGVKAWEVYPVRGNHIEPSLACHILWFLKI